MRCQEYYLSTEAAVETCFRTMLQVCSSACGLQPQHVVAFRYEVELITETLRTRAVAEAHRYASLRDEAGLGSSDRRWNMQGAAANRVRATQARDAALHLSGKGCKTSEDRGACSALRRPGAKPNAGPNARQRHWAYRI